MPISVADETMWTLGSFYSANSLQPSRYKLYVVIKTAIEGEDVIDPSLGKESKSEDLKTQCGEEMPAKRSLVETEAVIQACEECGKNYRTYVPGTICNLPGS
ncbi:hypothetical protein GBAR_LOCUS17212, partial [Geodia barretti]